jgi:hypothetical protein
MKAILLILALALACAGCSTPKYVKTPSTEPVRAAMSDASKAVTGSREKIASAKTAIAEAQIGAKELLRVSPVDLRPQIEALSFKLDLAQAELAEANTRADFGLVKLKEAEEKATTLDAEVQRLAISYSTVADKLEAVTADRNTQRGLAWKWRLYCGGTVALVAGFFVARQYLPFLKLI